MIDAVTDVDGPVIVRDEQTAPFFAAARRNELVIRRCVACQRWLGLQAGRCEACGSGEVTWERAGGAARLVTWAVVHSAPHRAFADQIPFVTGYVELAEGPWLPARILTAAPADLRTGAELAVSFVHPADGDSYPVFVRNMSSASVQPAPEADQDRKHACRTTRRD